MRRAKAANCCFPQSSSLWLRGTLAIIPGDSRCRQGELLPQRRSTLENRDPAHLLSCKCRYKRRLALFGHRGWQSAGRVGERLRASKRRGGEDGRAAGRACAGAGVSRENGCSRRVRAPDITTTDTKNGGGWEISRTEVGVYQNGGYWGTASGWYIGAMSLADRDAAASMARDFVAFLRSHKCPDGLPEAWEWFESGYRPQCKSALCRDRGAPVSESRSSRAVVNSDCFHALRFGAVRRSSPVFRKRSHPKNSTRTCASFGSRTPRETIACGDCFFATGRNRIFQAMCTSWSLKPGASVTRSAPSPRLRNRSRRFPVISR